MTITSIRPEQAQRRRMVTAEDGTALSVREYGPADAAMTVVLLHGHCLRSESWSFVRDALTGFGGAFEREDTRVVCYDHRGHGDSSEAAAASYTIEQLSRDLGTVLDAVVPIGPVVLIGHSMGGMTALTYAGRNPHQIGTRIVGVGLVATAANDLAEAGFGRFLRNPAVSWFQASVRRAPRLMHKAKEIGCKMFAPVINAAEYGNRKVPARVMALAAAMRNETPIVTMASFLSSFMTYDESAALPGLSAIPTLVLCGSADMMTPPSHSVSMAAQVEYADFVMVEGAGHSVILEQPQRVADAINRLLDRSRAEDLAAAA